MFRHPTPRSPAVRRASIHDEQPAYLLPGTRVQRRETPFLRPDLRLSLDFRGLCLDLPECAEYARLAEVLEAAEAGWP